MRALQASNSVNTRPMLIVRERGRKGVVTTIPADSLDDRDVLAQVERLRPHFPADAFDIDRSQVAYARQGLLGPA